MRSPSRRQRGRPGLLGCCSRLRYACALVGASAGLPLGRGPGQLGRGATCLSWAVLLVGTRLQDLPVLSPQASHDLGLGLLSGLQALVPWHYALKRIGGQFGSSVLSYFLFLKTLLAFNALLLLPLLAFLVGVQTAFPPAPRGPVPAFTGLELLTGGVRVRGIGPERHPLVSRGETPRPPL